jgi:endoglucanase
MTERVRRPKLSDLPRWGALFCVLAAAAGVALFPRVPTHAAVAITGLHVQGNAIVNSSGQTIRLLGVDRSGTEYACIQGWGFLDGPSDLASVQAMATWHVNAVRIPLNEDCWLGINNAPAAYSGSNYQSQIANYVNLLNANGMVAILDLHWNAPGTAQATGQQPMPDADHALAFWQSVAGVFKNNSSVIFDLYNEPYPDSNRDTTAAWTCWRDGGASTSTNCPGVGFTAVGMQALVTGVRNVGANNILMLGGVEYSNSLSNWLSFRPTDPQNNLAASWHSYNFNSCSTATCWNQSIAPVAQQVPIVAGEIGENDCAHGYIDGLMPWMDSHGVNYLGWTWDTWNCSSGPALISDYNGTPTNFGIGFRDHLSALANGTPTSTPTALLVTPTATSTPTATGTPTRTATPTLTPTPKPKHHH